nr:MAG TPA: hypothetical protein [Caudoviricetes sp.]
MCGDNARRYPHTPNPLFLSKSTSRKRTPK